MKNIKSELQEAKTFIDSNLDRIVDWSVGDIKRCCRMKEDGSCDDGGALVGAFILWCCAIDYFGGLYTGLTTAGATEARFKAFVEKYMSKYDYLKLKDFRWALTHYYSTRHFVMYHQNSLEQNKDIHLTSSSNGIMLHLGWAVKDLEDGVKQYCDDVSKDDSLKIKLWRYSKELYPLMPLEVTNSGLPKTYASLPSGATIQIFSVSGTTTPENWSK